MSFSLPHNLYQEYIAGQKYAKVQFVQANFDACISASNSLDQLLANTNTELANTNTKLLDNAALATPEHNGLAPKGGLPGQFFGVKTVPLQLDGETPQVGSSEGGEETPQEQQTQDVYGFFDLPASAEPTANTMPLGDEDGKIDLNWLDVVGEITSATPDTYLPDVGAVKKHVQKYMGTNPPNTDVWITSSQSWVAPITGTINILLVGGGGKGGNESGSSGSGSGAGGGGAQIVLASFLVTKNTAYPITIGASQGNSTAFGQTAAKGDNGANAPQAKGGNGSSGGGGGDTDSAYTIDNAGKSTWTGGKNGEVGSYSAGGNGGGSNAVFPFQLATAGGATANRGGGGGSTGIVTSTGSLISAGRGGGSAGYGGTGYGAGGGGASYSGSTIGGSGAPGVCIISYYDPDKA